MHRTLSSNFSQIGQQMAEIWGFEVKPELQALGVWNYQGNFHFWESMMDNKKWSVTGRGSVVFRNRITQPSIARFWWNFMTMFFVLVPFRKKNFEPQKCFLDGYVYLQVFQKVIPESLKKSCSTIFSLKYVLLKIIKD